MGSKRRAVAVLALFAAVAAACGGRLDEETIAAELAADSFDSGSGAGGEVASGGGPDAGGGGTITGGTTPATTAPGAGTDAAGTGADRSGGTPGATATTAPAGGSGGGGGAAPSTTAPSAPAEGNGGATDVGVTDTEITVGNVATLSGPVPGLFRGALIGTQAAFAYQNSLGGLYGRQFSVVSGDDAFDAGQNRSRHKELSDEVFAFVGSFSLFDSAGAAELEASGAPDIGRSLSLERQSLPNSYNPLPFAEGWPTTGCRYLKERFGEDVITKMAIFWGNAEAARSNAFWQREACETEGFEFIYERELQATETNFTGDIIQMRQRGVQGFFIVFDVTGIARFFKSLEQQSYDVPLAYPSPAAYDSDLVKLAGASAVEGAIIGQNLVMYLGEDPVPEVQLFLEWMAKVDPNQKVDIFALYGWQSARLFIEGLRDTGPEATRAELLQYLSGVREWDNFGTSETGNVGQEQPGFCETYMEVRNGQFVRVFPTVPGEFHCVGSFHPYSGG